MRTSNNGLKLIKEFESLHDGDLKKIGLQPKMDPVGIWTEGYGRAMRDKKGKFIKGSANKELAYSLQTINTVAEAEIALKQDVGPREHIVMQNIDVPLNQNQFDALVSYVYNTGGSNTLYNLINRNATKQEIYNWFTTRYIQSEGRVLQGLVKRRKREADLYFK